MKPDWSKAPPWAMYHAHDADGLALWYEKEPYFQLSNDLSWYSDGRITSDTNVCPNFRETLERRPSNDDQPPVELREGETYRTRAGLKAFILNEKHIFTGYVICQGIPFEVNWLPSGSRVEWQGEESCDIVAEWKKDED